MTDRMEFKAEFREGILVFSITGEIDVYTIAKIREGINLSLEKRFKHMIVDLMDVEYIDSSGIGFLVKLEQDLRQKLGCLGIVIPEGNVLELFQKTHLDRILNFSTTISGAMEYVKNSKGYLPPSAT